jgi:hypothetical protein
VGEPAGAATGSPVDAGAAGAVSAAPQSPQNFWPGGFRVPQAGHGAGRRAPHSPQNLAAAVSAWQAGQRTLASPMAGWYQIPGGRSGPRGRAGPAGGREPGAVP